MTYFLALCIALLWAAAGQAAPVIVNAGEHPESTRLIMSFDERPRWEMSQSGRSYRLDFETEEALAFDLSQVFRLIDRERVGDVRVSGEGLEIDISCECDVLVTPSGDNSLVADIRPRTNMQAAALGYSLPSPTVRTPDTSLPRRGSTMPGREAPTQPSRPSAPENSSFAFPTTRMPPLVEELSFLFDQPSRSAAVDLLGREFSRAAAQGLIAANPEINERAAVPPIANIDALSDRSNLAVVTGLDAALGAGRVSASPTELGAVCRPNESVDLRSWGELSDVQSLGRLRTELIAEDGGILSKGALLLSRYYLSMGFGAEALITSTHIEDDTERSLIRALAEVIDHGQSDSKVFDGQIYCSGAIALWATLARPIGPSNTPVSADYILSTFSALPPHLRAHLGPLLAERLRQADLPVAARSAINAVTRGGEKTSESELATARLDLDSTEAEAARMTLKDLSRGTDITAAEALVELLMDAASRDMAPNPNWVEDAPSLVRAIEGTDAAVDLNLASLRGLIALKRFDAFRKKIVEETPGLTKETREELAMLAVVAALETASDLEFIKTELGLSKLAPPEIFDRKDRFEIAQRLQEVGLNERAEAYLPQLPEGIFETEIIARALVADGRVNDALILLSKSTDPSTQILLGDILTSNGQNAEAIPVLEQSGRSEEALAAAIRTGDWQWVQENESTELSDAARILSTSTESVKVEDRPKNGELILSSRELRAQARKLLEATDPEIRQ